MKDTPNYVRVVEVGPRDGLQNEPGHLSPELKIELVNRLARAGLSHIEAGSFVSPKWVPQMASSDKVFSGIDRRPGVRYSALVPNLKGYEAAVEAGANEVAIFIAATETFSRKNTNCSISESLERFQPILNQAKLKQLPVRGYISCVLGCPYEGQVDPGKVADLAAQLIELGCYEVSLGDTIGCGTPSQAQALIREATKQIPVERLAIHFHDTYGQAQANIHACLELGVRVVDSSIAGLGGCPYAPGAGGNVATEDLLYLLQGCGYTTGIDLDQAINTGLWISNQLQRQTGSKVARARSGSDRNRYSRA